MKKTKWLPIIVSLVCLAGCAAKPVEKDWIAVGGSRSDATIRLGYTYNPKIEVPQLDHQQALELATQKCRAWGYDHAEEFGSVMENCGQMVYDPWIGPYCAQMNAVAEFQCIGAPATGRPVPVKK
ncbi:YecR family lipoprotein [Desulfovibrio sp. SGI.133]|uniref:YecR family lipoprotein n=1 Tax=Desulfovibrio sp. SGI.133 TaxID=3420560 RepID=UPI003D05D302